MQMNNGNRTIQKIVTGINTMDGAGVKLVRVFGHNDTKEFDPFLMLDAFDSTNPDDYTKGFPWHPHRGIETITYLIQGKIEHGDNLGNKGFILEGDCQWMTAGSGIIHQEMPKPSDRMLGVQLWLNLPSRYKMTNTKYRAILNNDIPVIEEKGVKAHILSGRYKNQQGAIEADYVKVCYMDVEMDPDSQWEIDTDIKDNIFIYILHGEAYFDDDILVTQKHAILFNEGEKIKVITKEKGARFLFLAGKPLHEPVAWGGPIVMNTNEELNLAFKELEENTFIKV